MKANTQYQPLLICAILVLGIVIGGWLGSGDEKAFLTSNNSKTKLNRLIDFIDEEYVDEVNTDSIVNVTVDNILGQLDPHSVTASRHMCQT
jgi:carboxyl-terminal processing protease